MLDRGSSVRRVLECTSPSERSGALSLRQVSRWICRPVVACGRSPARAGTRATALFRGRPALLGRGSWVPRGSACSVRTRARVRCRFRFQRDLLGSTELGVVPVVGPRLATAGVFDAPPQPAATSRISANVPPRRLCADLLIPFDLTVSTPGSRARRSRATIDPRSTLSQLASRL